MNTKRLMILLMVLVAAWGQTSAATFKTFTGGVQVATDTVDLTIPTRVPADGVVGTEQLKDGSVVPAKLDSTGDYSVNSMTLADKVQAAWADIRGNIYASGSLEIVGNADIGGDLTGVNASFTGAVEAGGFTALGELATAVKTKLLTGTTAGAEGASVSVAHGLTGAKIVSSTCIVRHTTNGGIFPESRDIGATGYEYSLILDSGGANFVVRNSPSNSSNILTKPFTIMVYYVK